MKESKLTLRELMKCNLSEIHLCDIDEDHELATIEELNLNTLTDEGKKAWADVLDSEVTSIYTGYYGLQIGVSGCGAERLSEFSFMLAGHCSAEDYDKWVNSSENAKSLGQKM